MPALSASFAYWRTDWEEADEQRAAAAAALKADSVEGQLATLKEHHEALLLEMSTTRTDYESKIAIEKIQAADDRAAVPGADCTTCD